MDDREQARLGLTRAVVRDLRTPEFRASLHVVDELGRKPIVGCLPDDTVEWVFARVRELGGDATVVMGTAVAPGVFQREFMVVTKGIAAEADPEPCGVHPHSEVGLLMAYLREHGGRVQCQMLAPDSIATLATV
jgi:hypothetical protein